MTASGGGQSQTRTSDARWTVTNVSGVAYLGYLSLIDLMSGSVGSLVRMSRLRVPKIEEIWPGIGWSVDCDAFRWRRP